MERLSIGIRFSIGEERVECRVQIPQPLHDQFHEFLCRSFTDVELPLMPNGDVVTNKDIDAIECWIERTEI